MDAPNFQLKEVVVRALEHSGSIATGSVMKVAGIIVGLILALHIAEGAAELASRRGCRFFETQWWFRLILVIVLLCGYESIVIRVGMAHVPTQMLGYTTSWQEVWEAEWDAIDTAKRNDAENKKLRETEQEQKYAGAEAAGVGMMWSGVMKGFWGLLDGLVSAIGVIISVVLGLGLCLLMLVQAFWVLGLLLLLGAIGPICIAFALHPATSSIFWAFFRQILVYEFLYLPLLGIACSIAGVIMGRVTATFSGSGIEYADGTNVAVHLLMAVLGPLCSFAVVKGTPAALLAVFGGGDSGGAGGSLANQVGDRLKTAAKGMALNVFGAGAGAAGGGAAGAGAAGGGAMGGLASAGSKVSGDSARGVS